jgi:beta-glucosidase/6-phospho-beta-glucosidase/beta-galactosidase
MVTAMIHEKQGHSPGGRGPDGKLRGVGLANAFSLYDPYDPESPMDRRVAEVMADLNNWAFVRAVFSERIQFNIPSEVPNSHSYDRAFPKDDFSGPLSNSCADWLGVNYYMRWLMQYRADYQVRAEWHTPEGPRADNGWNIYPEGLERILRQTAEHFPAVPLVVTENGLADANDDKRPDFIRDHLRALDKAVLGSERGPALDVRGYFHWSLTDNFEWQSGLQYRFGLVAIDYAQDCKRTARPSAAVYRDEVGSRRDK